MLGSAWTAGGEALGRDPKESSVGSGTGLMGIPGGSGHPAQVVLGSHAAGAYPLQHSESLYLNKQHSKADLKINI